MRISRIIVQKKGGKTRFVSSTQWGEAQRQSLWGAVEQAIDRVYQNRMNIVSSLRNVLGKDTTNKVVARLDQVSKKLRR